MVTQNHCLPHAGASCLIKMFMSLTGSSVPVNQIQSPIWAFPHLEGTTYQGTTGYGYVFIAVTLFSLIH